MAVATDFFSSPNRPHRLQGPSSLLCNGHGVKRPGRAAEYSNPPSVEAKNEWSYTSTTPTCFHGVYRDGFTFTFLLDPMVIVGIFTFLRVVY
jgi:hypothetical protein